MPLSRIGAALRALLPPSAACAVSGPDTAVGPLYAEEQVAVATASTGRREEFARGRDCARRALAQIGCPPAPLPRGQHGAPIAPLGTLLSISHTSGIASAVAAPTGAIIAIGVDLETLTPITAAAARRVAGADELMATPQDRPSDLWPLAIFSIKEAVYKAIYPRVQRRLDFADVAVRAIGPKLQVQLRCPRLRRQCDGLTLVIAQVFVEGFVLSLAVGRGG